MVSIQRSLASLSKDLGIAVLLLNEVQDVYQPRFAPAHTTIYGAFAPDSYRLINGPTYSYGVDLHVMLSQHPHAPESAKSNGSAKEDTVLEVLVDRVGGRTGRWGVFRIVGINIEDVRVFSESN